MGGNGQHKQIGRKAKINEETETQKADESTACCFEAVAPLTMGPGLAIYTKVPDTASHVPYTSTYVHVLSYDINQL